MMLLKLSRSSPDGGFLIQVWMLKDLLRSVGGNTHDVTYLMGCTSRSLQFPLRVEDGPDQRLCLFTCSAWEDFLKFYLLFQMLGI